MKIFHYPHPFSLECGKSLNGLRIAYHTYGKLNDKKDNCIWVCHALTANSDVADWWKHTVEKDSFLDPEKYFIVCANIIGSCYGTTGPLSTNPETGTPYYDKFPDITIRDIVNAHILLADHLKLNYIASLIGSSVGGFQVFEWAVTQPQRFGSIITIATDVAASPWTVAINETQRMSIFADESYGRPDEKAARAGLAAARAIGMLSYRGPSGYNLSQKNIDITQTPFPKHRASSYQNYQGEKLTKRFDAYSYVTILNSFDTHNIGRGRNGVNNALKQLKMPVLLIGITTDIVFPVQEIKAIADKIENAYYHEIDSPFGHDGFLVEHEALKSIIKNFFIKIELEKE